MISYEKKLMKLNEKLLQNIKKNLPKLEELLISVCGHWNYEDLVYRYYHGSFKVYYAQNVTIKIVKALKELSPKNKKLNTAFEDIIKKGTGKKFSSDHNDDWDKHTRPILEAFFHAKYFLEMICKYGKELEEAPACLPSGWATVLCLFNMR